MKKSLRKRSNVLVGLRLMDLGTGQNLRPSPTSVWRYLGRIVVGLAMSCKARFDGRER